MCVGMLDYYHRQYIFHLLLTEMTGIYNLPFSLTFMFIG
jgi:hypothetical protein